MFSHAVASHRKPGEHTDCEEALTQQPVITSNATDITGKRRKSVRKHQTMVMLHQHQLGAAENVPQQQNWSTRENP